MRLPVTSWRIGLVAAAIQAGLVVLAAIFALMLYQARLSAHGNAKREAASLARVLQDGIEKDVEVTDLSLHNVDADLRLIEEHHLAPELRSAVLTNDAIPTEAFGALVVTDDTGHIVFDSAKRAVKVVDLGNQDYFRSHRADPDLGLLLSVNSSSRVSSEPVLLLTRRLNHPDGSFAGIAAESIRLSVFKTLFNTVELGPDDDVLLNTIDGHAIFRRSSGARFFGVNLTDSPAAKAVRASSDGIGEGASLLDGISRLWATCRLHKVGLTVVVGLSLRGIYAAWLQEAVIIGSVVALLLLLAGFLGASLRRQLMHRAQAETALRESEINFRLLSEAGSDMVSRVDAKGKCRYVSPAATRLLGAAPECLLGTALLNLVLPEDRPIFSANTAKLLAGVPHHETLQFRVCRADGAIRWIDAAGRSISDPVTEADDGYIVSWRDVTDRKQAEQLLVESETRYRLLTENSSDVITCLSLDLRRTYVSPASLAVLGYEPSELLGLTPSKSIHPDDAPMVADRFRLLSEGIIVRDVLTNRFRHKAGHYVWVEVKTTLLRDPATTKPNGILCVIRDISDRKAAADELVAANQDLERLSRHLARARDTAEHASAAKSGFLASVSHELRTPLNGILGYTELLHIEGGLNETQTARIDAMRAAGQHLLSMITGVLDLSEIETGRLHLYPVVVDLGDIAADSLAVVQPLAQRKGLTLICPSVAEGPVTVNLDATRLRQIMLNLLGNAVKFTGSGSVTLRYFEIEQDRVRIEVVDTGPGIAASQRWRLFQEFDRMGDIARGVEGAGLGLALSHRLATAMDGEIGYADNPGGGSVFWLEFPQGVINPTGLAGVPAVNSSPGDVGLFPNPVAQQCRILVVDDVAINRDIAASFLAAAGHRTVCAESGEQAVALATAEDFDLVLMDVRMPGLDGREATRQIRALAGHRGQVPVVALTAQAFADEVVECRRAGMNEHLAKPFSQPALLKVVERVRKAGSAGRSGSGGVVTAPQGDYGAELAVLDEAVFAQVAGYLSGDSVVGHVNSLILRTETLLTDLADGQAAVLHPGLDQNTLVAAAHALAGSAGMFGFERLSNVARQFEYVAEKSPESLPRMAESLRAAAVASLLEMRRRTVSPPVASMAQ